MTVGEFREKAYTLDEATKLLDARYSGRVRLITTRLGRNPGFEKPCQWRRGEKLKYIQSLAEVKVPHHFTYIKFYANKDYGESLSKNEIFPLVVGKTSYRLPASGCTPYKTDLSFSETGGAARQWLQEQRSKYLWYTEKILVVWAPAAEDPLDDGEVKKLAFSVESDIAGLLGLFSS